ncbi:MAG: hypothetical protein ACP5RP_03510 [Candidatus Micrarchaeia archaeon]
MSNRRLKHLIYNFVVVIILIAVVIFAYELFNVRTMLTNNNIFNISNYIKGFRTSVAPAVVPGRYYANNNTPTSQANSITLLHGNISQNTTPRSKLGIVLLHTSEDTALYQSPNYTNIPITNKNSSIILAKTFFLKKAITHSEVSYIRNYSYMQIKTTNISYIYYTINISTSSYLKINVAATLPNSTVILITESRASLNSLSQDEYLIPTTNYSIDAVCLPGILKIGVGNINTSAPLGVEIELNVSAISEKTS